MGKYEYLAVPFVGQLKQGVFSVENAKKVTEQLQGVINHCVQQGYEFYRIDKVGVQVTPGCIASLFGASVSSITFDPVIFRRPTPQAA